MAVKDNLGNRMKDYYESRSQIKLLRRIPVIIRVDGKSFSHFCKRFQRPHDKFLHMCLDNTLKYLCKNVQCVKLGQRHSDEMSLLLTDYEDTNTEPYFDYKVQKMCSVVASMASTEFCKQLITNMDDVPQDEEGNHLYNAFDTYGEDWPVFDARCFNLPEFEVSNYFWWRLLDAKRNSINMLAQSLFSHRELQGKTCNEMQEMMFSERGVNWDKIPQEQKSGTLCIKTTVEKPIEEGPKAGEMFSRSVWKLYPAPKIKEGLNVVVFDALPSKEEKEEKE